MLRPTSRRVRRAHSAPHSRIRSTPTLPQCPTPVITGNGNLLYIDATPPGSVVSVRERDDVPKDSVQTPSLINGRPIVRRTRHYSEQQPQHCFNQKVGAQGRLHLAPPPPSSSSTPVTAHLETRKSGYNYVKHRRSGRHQQNHHRSAGNLSQIPSKPGSLCQQPQTITRWYEVDDSGSQTSLGSEYSHHQKLVPPLLTIQPPSSQNLSVPEPESSQAYLDSYPPSPYEYDSGTVGPFSAAFEEFGCISPSFSFYDGLGYVPSPLAFDAQASARSNILHVPMSPISPYTVVRPKSPAPSIGSQISTSTIQVPCSSNSRPAPVCQSTPLDEGRDQTKLNLMPKLNEEDRCESEKPPSAQSTNAPGSPSHNSHSLDCLESGTKRSPQIESSGKDLGRTTSSPSLRVNRLDPSVFRFPHPQHSDGRGRQYSTFAPRRTDYRSKTLSRLPRSTSQTSVLSLSMRSDVSASAASVISTRSDMWGGRRGGGMGHARFSRQYYSYRRPTVPNTRGQRAYKSFRQELLLRSMLCVYENVESD